MKREFDLADVLSVTCDRLLSHNHIGGVYEILGYMTGEDLMTHQLPRAQDACAPVLLDQHPQLAGVEPPENIDIPDLMAWLSWAEAEYGMTLPVEPLSEWKHIDPIEEACDLFGAEKVFVLPLDSP